MRTDSPAPTAPATSTFISTPSTFTDGNDFLPSFVHENGIDLTLDLTLMPQFFTADSPTSSLSTPTTQLSFEDSQSSDSSSLSYPATSFAGDKVSPYLDAFIACNNQPFLEGALFPPSAFADIKQETAFFFNPFQTFGDVPYPSFELKPEPIHRSIEMPASPQTGITAEFPPMPSYERNMTGSIRPFQHALPSFSSSYTSSSSEETISEAPPSPQLVKKPARIAKQDKGIKCDHCGIDKTPLWRKVPHKENAYHCNACGLYYKSNGHFRASDGESRVVRTKKVRKVGDVQVNHPFRTGPVTANRNVTCANCGTNNTVLWRKGPDGQSPLCNPCGLFYKLHNSHRSPEKKKEIHRRNRAGKKRFSISTVNSSWSSAEEGDDEIDSPVETVFTYSQHQQQEHVYVKAEERDFGPPPQLYLPEPQYQYQWQGQSVPGRC